MDGFFNIMLEKIFVIHKDLISLPLDRLAIYFVAMVLHHPKLVRLCGVAKPFTDDEIREQAAEATRDFIDTFCDRH